MTAEISLNLRIAEDLSDDSVRIDQSDLRLLRVQPGDTVALTGGRTSYARAIPALMEDRNQRLARVSSQLLFNTKAPDNAPIKISALTKTPELAEKVVLEVTDDIDNLHLSVRLNQLTSLWHERIIVVDDRLRVPTIDKFPLEVRIAETIPAGPVQVCSSTEFQIICCNEDEPDTGLAGLRDVYRTCRIMADKRLNGEIASTAKSILLTGPAGCGKAQLVKRLAEDMKVGLRVIDAHTLLDRYVVFGNSDLETIFSDLSHMAPIIMLLDNMEALNEHQYGHMAISHICNVLDELRMHRKIILFGICSSDPDPRFLSNRRFDVVLPVDAPDRLARQEMLVLATRDAPLDDTVDLKQLANATRGCTAADLRRLVTMADLSSEVVTINHKDFAVALRAIVPSALNPLYSDVPDVSWESVGGLDEIKALFRETLVWSLQRSHQFREADVHPPRCILVSGGQGTGKTTLVRAVASITPLNLIEVPCPTLLMQDQGAMADFVHKSFALARKSTPCMIFFDDIDALLDPQNRGDEPQTPNFVIAQLMDELDHLSDIPGVIVVGATNRPDRLMNEMMRPGRFDYAITLPMPDIQARKKILQIHSKKFPMASDIDFDQLAVMTQGMSPADITNLCNRVGLLALRQSFSGENGVIPPVVNAALFDQVIRGRKTVS
ncbi:MAG: AAA family ATPase [Alphaproteobacteria bacterium]|nr:AAA family ATPase [Alphaproteobacteria bacterium]